MGATLQITFTVIFIVELTVGSIGNGFIAFMNWMDWIKRKPVSCVDQILTALAVSRIALFSVLLLECWLSLLYPSLLMDKMIIKLIDLSWTLTNHFRTLSDHFLVTQESRKCPEDAANRMEEISQLRFPFTQVPQVATETM